VLIIPFLSLHVTLAHFVNNIRNLTNTNIDFCSDVLLWVTSPICFHHRLVAIMMVWIWIWIYRTESEHMCPLEPDWTQLSDQQGFRMCKHRPSQGKNTSIIGAQGMGGSLNPVPVSNVDTGLATNP
jgi:hypothetical protein